MCTPKLPRLNAPFQCQPTQERSMAAMDFKVLGSTANVYTVTLDFRPTCDCPNFKNKKDICKHIFFVLLKVVRLPEDSSILYQKAYLSNELALLYAYLAEHTPVAPNVVAEQKVQAAYQKTKAEERKPKARKCAFCDAKVLNQRSTEIINCPTRHCTGTFHVDCAVLIGFNRLSLSDETTHRGHHHYRHFKNSTSTRTTTIKCPLCKASFDHDEGYVNLADVTGQSRIRDTSSYRPVPYYALY